MTIIHKEKPATVLGVQGRYHGATVGGSNYKPGTFTMQRWSASKSIRYHGEPAMLSAQLRFDDDCRNGHNTFAITAEIRSADKRKQHSHDGGWLAGGCMHDEIAKHFSALAPLLKWHLCSTDGPMHYVANTVYMAGDRDHHGKRAGEPTRFAYGVRFGGSPITHKVKKSFWEFFSASNRHDLEVIRYDHKPTDYPFGPKFTFGGYGAKWHECPFDTEAQALEWLEAGKGPTTFHRIPVEWSKGKARELDKARDAAIWPDATDEELSVEPDVLREALEARLPALLSEFREAVGTCGFAWAPPVEATP